LESSFLFVKKLFLFLKKFEKFIKLFLALCVNSLSYGGMGINIVGILHKIYYSLRFGIINYLSKYFKKPAVILLKNKNLNSNFLFYKKVKNRIVIVSNYIHKNISYNSFLNYKKKIKFPKIKKLKKISLKKLIRFLDKRLKMLSGGFYVLKKRKLYN
jgi:hypothetical protein